MNTTYKQLTDSDVPLLRQLLAVFGKAFHEPDTYQGSQPTDDYLKTLLSRRHFIALVALDDTDKVCGGLAAYELEKFEQARSEIYIYDLAVSESVRRKGIARALINTLRDIARERAAYVIFVQADPGDDPAIKLYESFGVREDAYQFDIPVK